MNFIKEESGQAGAVFRLMVDGIIGLVILMMILSTMAYFESLSYESNRIDFLTKVTAAVQTPNGEIISMNDPLRFAEGSGFNSLEMRALTGHGYSCFEFQSNLSYANIANDNEVEFTQNVSTKVYIKCDPSSRTSSCYGEDDDCCEIECLISFGKKIN